MTSPIFVRPNKAPDVFGISRSTLYRWRNRKAFRIVNRGGVAFVRAKDVSYYMETGRNVQYSKTGEPIYA